MIDNAVRRACANLSLVVPVRDPAHTDLAEWNSHAELPFVDEVIVVQPADAPLPTSGGGTGVRFIQAPLGRASQMNAGALATGSEFVFFLHGDTSVEPGALLAVLRVLRSEDVAVALSLRFDSDRSSYRVLERLSRLRDRILPSPLGDQGLAMRRDRFLHVGGFPDEPLCEDLAMSRRLRRCTSVRVLAEVALTSPARFERHGVWRTFGHDVFLVAWHALGASPRTLVRRYYGAAYLARWLAADSRRGGRRGPPLGSSVATAPRQLPSTLP
jgi:hypothetical protein